MSKFDGTKIIMGGVAILLGLILLPVIASFVYGATHEFNRTALPHHYIANPDTTSISGILPLVLYGFCFGLVGLGIGLIYIGFKK